MKRFRLTWLLLALALLGGQWLAVAHSAEHTALQADDALCVLCVQTHNLEQAQTHHTTVFEVDRTFIAPDIPSATVCFSAHRLTSNIRAPPRSVL